MSTKLIKVWPTIFLVALFTLIPLWNIPHTIAGRYVCEGILLIGVFLYRPEWKLFFQKNIVLVIFFIYLIIQLLFFSENFLLALSNFRAEWMHFILFSIIGAGAGLIFGKKDPKKLLLFLGIAFSGSLYIHILLAIFKGISTGHFPWNYRGISDMHGDFGYPALEAGILFFSFYLYQAKTKFLKFLSLLLMFFCIASPMLASSRGGVLFAATGILATGSCFFLLNTNRSIHIGRAIIFIASALIIALTIHKIGLIQDPNRWGGISSRLMIGLEGDANIIHCEGIQILKDTLQKKGVEITPAVQKQLDSVIDGDGARILAARSGIQLALTHPMGINQSKQAYQYAMSEYCNAPPKIFISHAHNAWIDTALAIGIPGAILLLLCLIQYAWLGYKSLQKNNDSSVYGLALFVSASIWIIRGLLDSTMRDQMLEMQAFIFALLLGIIITSNKRLKQTY